MNTAAVALGVAVVAAARGSWSPCGLSMVSAINPIAERSRGHRYSITVLWYVLGALIGGVGLGAVAAAGAWAAAPLQAHPASGYLLAVAGCLVAVAADVRLCGFALPGNPRQVNEVWLTRYRRWIYASGYGVQIGVGFATYIMTAAVYLTVVLGALTGSPRAAFVVGMTFGLVRGLEVLLTARVRRVDDLYRLHARLEVLAPWSVRVVVFVECAAAVVLAAAGGGMVSAAAAVAVLAIGWPVLALGRARQASVAGVIRTRTFPA